MRPALRSMASMLVVCASALLAATPGDGEWEINLAALGDRTRAGRWDVSLPDADINFGWGDRIQLKVDVPWTFVREPGEGWESDLGTGSVGVKWRFVDGGEGQGFLFYLGVQLLR
jgi:hypothetical protein